MVVAVLLLVSACTSGTDPGSDASASSTPAPSSSSAGPVPLRLAVYGGPEELRSYQRLARVFMRQHPGVKVTVETAAGDAVSRNRLEQEFASGTGPDVFLTSSSDLPALVADGRVQPVDELL